MEALVLIMSMTLNMSVGLMRVCVYQMVTAAALCQDSLKSTLLDYTSVSKTGLKNYSRQEQ